MNILQALSQAKTYYGLVFLSLFLILAIVFGKRIKITGFLALISLGLLGLSLYESALISPLIFALAFFGGLFLILEAMVPGFGLFGVLGLSLILISLFFPVSLIPRLYSIGLALLIDFVIGLIAFKCAGDWSNKLVLEDRSKDNLYDKSLIGLKGTSLTILRPSGQVEVEGKRYDGETLGEFIEKGKNIVVINIVGKRLIVKAEKE